MANDANEHVPAKLRAEEEAAEREYMEGVQTPDDVIPAVVDDPDAPEPPISEPAEPPAPPADDPMPPADGDTPPQPQEGPKGPGTLEQQLAEATARAERAESQYKTLMGKYNAEIPRGAREVADLKRENTDLKAKLAQAPAGGTEAPANAATPASPKADLPKATDPDNPYDLTADEREYGTDMISVAEKIARKMVASEIGDVRTKADSAAAALQQQARQTFLGELDGLAPDWREINGDKAFAEFCDTIEPNSGLTWQEIIDRGQSGMNAVQVSGVFNAFRARKGDGATPAKPTSQPAATTPIEAQVAPQAAPSPAPGVKRTYTVAEYSRLMENVARGTYGLGSKRAQKIEAELDKALSEGRVKG